MRTAVLGFLGLLVALGGGFPVVSPSLLGQWAALALVLEMTAPRLTLGFMSSAPAVYLAAQWSLGPSWGLAVAWVCIGLRTLLRAPRLQELALELPALCLAAAATRLLANWSAPVVATGSAEAFLLGQLMAVPGVEQALPVQARPEWRRARAGWGLRTLALACLGWAMAHGDALIFLIPLLVLQRTWVNVPQLQQKVEGEVQGTVEALKAHSHRASAEAGAARREMRSQIEQRVLLEDLSTELLARPDAVGETVIRAVRRVVSCQSVILYNQQGSPLASSTPCHAQDAWNLSIPLPQMGMLYIGRSQAEPLSPEEVRALELVARQATLGLWAAQRLAYHAEAHLWLESWSQGLSRLLAAMPGLLALDAARVVEHLAEQVEGLVPHDSLLIVGPDFPTISRPPGFDYPGLAALPRPDLPLLLHEGTLLAAPLGEQGWLLLGSHGSFTVQHQQLLHILSFQVGVALANANLYAQLIQSSKMAAVGQLAAGVAHELNNPLGAIVLAVESSQKMAERPATVRRLLDSARSAADRARSIVDKLLYYAREGRMVTVALDLEKVIEDTLELIGKQLALDAVTVEHRNAGAPVWVKGNANELQQVLINLLLNARDAVAEAEMRRIVVSSGPHWVAVEDSGPGVPPDVAGRIFDPFFTTKPVGRGTGLGLSVSREIVQAHQGTLVLAGPSRFVVTLPAASPGAGTA